MALNRCAWVLWASVYLAHSALGQERLARDVNGDPLPAGAISRLGQLAFRVAAPVETITYLDGGGKLLVKTRARDYRIDACFQLFDAHTGKELNHFTSQQTAEAQALWHEHHELYSRPEWCLSSNGKWLARVDPVAGKGITRVQWQEVSTGQIAATIEASNCYFHQAQFSPDGKYLAVIAAQAPYNQKSENESAGVIRMWEVATRREVRTFALPPKSQESFWPCRFAFSPDGAHLAASGRGDGKSGMVRVWAVAGDKLSWALEGQPHQSDCPTPFAFAPNGKTVAAFHDGKLGLWDAATGKPLKVLAAYGEPCAILAFSPTGSRLLTCKAPDINRRGPTRIQMWDCPTGRQFDLPVDHPAGFAFSRGDDTLIVADQERILVCDGATGQVKHSLVVENLHPDRNGRELGWPFALSPDGATLAFGDRAGQLRRFSVATGKALPALGIVSEVADALAFSADGKKLLAVGKTQVLLHEVDGSRPPLRLLLNSVENAKARDFHQTPRVHVGNQLWPNANCVALASDGRHAAAGWTNGLVAVWDTASGKLLWQKRGVDVPIHGVTFAAGDQTVISSGLNGQVIWWDVATGRIRRQTARVPGKEFNDYHSLPYRFSPGGRTAFGMSPDSQVLEEWELASGKVRHTLDVVPYPVDFTRDGRSMLVIGEDAYHSIDLITGRPLRSFAWAEYPQPETNPYGWCRFSPDGGVVAGFVHYATLRFWDADAATPLASVSDRAGFTALAFAPDGKTLATAGGDGTILMWRTPPRSARDKAVPPARPPADLATAKEADGSPLPKGARARLGLWRFQNGDNVVALRYSADGHAILAATESSASQWESDLGLAFWDSTTGKLLHRTHVLREHRLRMGGLGSPPPPDWLVSPDGRLLATVNLPGRKNGETALSPLVVRDLATGKTLVTIEGESFGRFSVVRFSPDSKTLATVDGEVKLHDLSTGKVRSALPFFATDFRVADAHFTPNGRLMIFVGSTKDSAEVRCWHLDRGGVAKVLSHRLFAEGTGEYQWVGRGSISLAPDSRHLAIVAKIPQQEKPHVILVEIETGKLVHDFGEQFPPPQRLGFSPSGTQLTALFPDKLERWEVSTGKRLPPIRAGWLTAVQFSPDDKSLAVADSKEVRCCDARTGAERYRIPCAAPADRQRVRGQGEAVAFSPDGKKLTVAHGRVIRQWDVATGQEIGPTPYTDTIHSVAAARDARWVAACSSREVQVWDATGKVVRRVASWPDAGNKQPVALTAVALSADGRRLAVGGSDGAVELLDVPTGKRLGQLRFHHAPVTSLVFVADGSELVTADLMHQAARWNAASGQQLQKYAIPPRADRGTPKGMNSGPEAWHKLLGSSSSFSLLRSFGPVLSPDGERLVTLSQKTLTIWRLNPAAPQKPVIAQPHQGKFAVSADGRFLVTGPNWDESYYIDRDAALSLIDEASGNTERSFANFPRIRNFDIAPDGKLLAACSTDGLCLWDTATGTRQATFNGHRGIVTSVAFSPDGRALISAAQDGTVLVWDIARLIAAPALKSLALADLDSLWNDLAAPDAQTVAKAMQRLTSHPQQTVALLRKRLKPAAISKERLAQLVAVLDDERFDIRDLATKELEHLAEVAEPTLRAYLSAKPTLEQKQRIEQILGRLSEPVADPNKLRALRCVQMLVVIGSPGAIELLQMIAASADGADETRDARAVLKWLKR